MRRTFLSTGTPQTEDKRWYVLQNRRQDAVVIISEARRPPRTQRERVFYSPYGRVFGMVAGDTDFDGHYGTGDSTTISNWNTDPYRAYADVDLDGTIDGTDASYATNDNMGWDVLSRDGSTVGYAGYVQDDFIATVSHVRHRVYKSDLGRWVQRDPAGYVDGANLYEYVRSSPVGLRDPMGLASSFGQRKGCIDKPEPRIWRPGTTSPQFYKKATWLRSQHWHTQSSLIRGTSQAQAELSLEMAITQTHSSLRVTASSLLFSHARYTHTVGPTTRHREAQQQTSFGFELECDGTPKPVVVNRWSQGDRNAPVSTTYLGSYQLAVSAGVESADYHDMPPEVLFVTPNASGAAAERTSTGGGITVGATIPVGGDASIGISYATNWSVGAQMLSINGFFFQTVAWYCTCTVETWE